MQIGRHVGVEAFVQEIKKGKRVVLVFPYIHVCIHIQCHDQSSFTRDGGAVTPKCLIVANCTFGPLTFPYGSPFP